MKFFTHSFLKTHVPEWQALKIASCEKYLGIYIGPGATAVLNWEKPLAKACERVRLWSLGLGHRLQMQIFNSSIAIAT